MFHMEGRSRNTLIIIIISVTVLEDGEADGLLRQFFFFFFFFCVPQLYLWGSPLLGEVHHFWVRFTTFG